MPPSQLKQLKNSLREHGFIGPQQSKKQRRQSSKDAGKRLERRAALDSIRERFNPFEVKAPARKAKFGVVSNKIPKSHGHSRPGVTKGLGEERRRETMLKEIQNRHKVGGIIDRRFGENDPTMTPEQRAAERFARQSEQNRKKSSMFNLEDEEEEGDLQLTHGGRTLSFGDEIPRDDYEVSGSSETSDISEDDGDRPRKRRRLSTDESSQDETVENNLQLTERKKSKQEVMKEVIAKSKLHKYERQQAKEDDDDLRAELDKGLPEFYDAMRNHNPPPKINLTVANGNLEPQMNPDRAALLAGKDREDADKEYNEWIRQMAMDARSKPSDRTKTEDEKAAQAAERLRELEEQRLRRMQNDPGILSDAEHPEEAVDGDDEVDDAMAFGLLSAPINGEARPQLDVEDEDDFVLDDDLIASDSDADLASGDEEVLSEAISVGIDDDGDDDFINGLVLPENANRLVKPSDVTGGSLAFTYPCPQTHAELLQVIAGSQITDLPVIIQRIRALHHPQLASGNKDKLETFSGVLIDHLAYLADQPNGCSDNVMESLIRHLHSLAKSFPEAVSSNFRSHLKNVSAQRAMRLTYSDLILLTSITIFSTSDHFHTVVTPANLVLARYLGQYPVQSLADLATGAYCCTLALRNQRLSKRFIPECINYILNALAILSPTPLQDPRLPIPLRVPEKLLRLTSDEVFDSYTLNAKDLKATGDDDGLKQRLIRTFTALLGEGANLWQEKSAFNEIFEPARVILKHILKACATKGLLQRGEVFSLLKSVEAQISSLQSNSLSSRRPLLLHNHRPLAIKMSIPKFEESYNPDRHYDPDRERSALNKLKAEHKRERKGALRELRKDANFIARESLREKKEKDAAYEKKFKRLVAEIQGEEGREAKEYEREKRKRKGKW